MTYYKVSEIEKLKLKYNTYDVSIRAFRNAELHCPSLFPLEHIKKHWGHMYIVEHSEDSKRKCNVLVLSREPKNE